MKFLVNAQLPPAPARHLRSLGYEASHVDEHGMRHTDDPDILLFASRQNCCILTKDEDFQLRWLFGHREVPIVWLRYGNISNQELKERLSPLIEDIRQRLREGETLIELR